MAKKPSIEFRTGMTIGIMPDECHGVITEVADDMLYIESECFTGWAGKEEIEDAVVVQG